MTFNAILATNCQQAAGGPNLNSKSDFRLCPDDDRRHCGRGHGEVLPQGRGPAAGGTQ